MILGSILQRAAVLQGITCVCKPFTASGCTSDVQLSVCLQAKLVALIAQYGESDSQLAVGAPVQNLLFWSDSGSGALGSAPDMSVHSLELSDCLQGVGLLCESV